MSHRVRGRGSSHWVALKPILLVVRTHNFAKDIIY